MKARGPGGLNRLSVGQWLLVSIGALLVVAVAGVATAMIANAKTGDRRDALLDRIGPARVAALTLETALVNQETGIRGFALSGEQRFLGPYRTGLSDQATSLAQIRTLRGDEARGIVPRAVAVQAAADAWRGEYVAPVLRGEAPGRGAALSQTGKARFDAVRAALTGLQGALNARRDRVRSDLESSSTSLSRVLWVTGALIVVSMLAAALLVRRIVAAPLERLGTSARSIVAGSFEEPVEIGSAPRDITQVAADVEAMRARIVRELAQVEAAREALETQARDLERSNADLEQFAYVASHDLQEPLRKVASFSELLGSRYQGQLDERADKYIAFIIGGAKRMQVLITDLLAFSRAGRSDLVPGTYPARELVDEACEALSSAMLEAGASVTCGELPVVRGDRSLLTAVFQNLIGNAVKFRGDAPPAVHVDAAREAGTWRFSVTDNGIGVAPEFGDRIFLIFQRLHPRDVYGGTGIGLAMCRKIVEYHGGRIWLDTTYTGGTRFCFTLPAALELT